MGFLSGLLGGGDNQGAGIGNSTTSQQTTYNEKYANVADYAKYSNVGSVVDLKGIVGTNKINIAMLDGGAIKQAFDFASNAQKMAAQGEAQTVSAIGKSTRNAFAHLDQSGTRNRQVMVMGVVMVGGVVLMMWLGSGKRSK